MKPKIPEPLQIEHNELHTQLVEATKVGGKTGEAAKTVAAVLHPHFVEEEEYALPPLGVLRQLAQGKTIPQAREVLDMTTKLRARLQQMLDEHTAIVTALEQLRAAATAESHPEYVRFAEKLILHARTEEEVLYPAALLIGEVLGSRLK